MATVRKTIFPFCLLLLLACSLNAQPVITGRVTDSSGNLLNKAVVVRLLEKSGEIAAQSPVDSLGGFVLSGLAGKWYRLSAEHENMFAYSPDFPLNIDTSISIRLTRLQVLALGEVKVTASKPLVERKIDRTIFNVENSLAAAGTDLTQALALAPLVRVDENGISIIGKGNVAVMINDRLLPLSGADLISYLRSLRSDDISRIEIITTPPARFEAQGNSGIINIILKKPAYAGWNGNISHSTMIRTYVSVFNNASVNYRSARLSASLKLRQTSSLAWIDEQTDVKGVNSVLSSDPRKSRTQTGGVNVSLDYQLGKASVGFIYDLGKTKSLVNIFNTTMYMTASLIDSILSIRTNTENPVLTQSLNIYYDQPLRGKGRKLSTGINYFSNQPQTLLGFASGSDQSGGQTFIKSDSRLRYNVWSVQSDLLWTSGKTILETGGKFTRFDNRSDMNYFLFNGQEYVNDPGRSNTFQYNEDNLAAYISAQREFGKRWSSKAGLRYEHSFIAGHSLSSGEKNRSDYGNLFPSAYLSYKAGRKGTFTFSYSKRINRPGLRAVNPARWYASPYTYYTGNPYLQPSYNHNYELSWVHTKGLSVTTYLQRLVNGYGYITLYDAPYKIVNAYNYLRQQNTGVTITLNLRPRPWWETNNYINGSLSWSSSENALVVPERGHQLSYSTNHTIKLNKMLSCFVNFRHSFPSRTANQYSPHLYFLTAGVRAAMPGNRIFINVTGNDILRSGASRGRSYFRDYTQYAYTYYDSRTLNITVSVSLGKLSVKNKSKQVDFRESNRAN